MSIEIRPAPLPDKHYYSIDILRGIAAFAVLVFHYTNFFLDPRNLTSVSDAANLPFAHIFSPLYTHGYLAVQLFWGISGFVFCHIYAQRKDVELGTFALSRFARLYPLHFITLLACLLLQTVSLSGLGYYQIYPDNDAAHFILHVFMASGWEILPGGSFNAPAWSVSAEIISYLIFWIVLRSCAIQVKSALGCLFAALVAYKIYPSGIAMCTVYFFSGVLVYRLNSLLRHGPWIPIALLSTVAIFRLQLSGLVLLATVSSVLWLLVALEDRKPLTWAHSVRWIGDITYSSYLWHVPLQIAALIILDSTIGSRAILFSATAFVGYLFIVTLTAAASRRWLEAPLQKWILRAAASSRSPSELPRRA